MSPDKSGQTGLERLQLADWRRRIGELYAQVREMSIADPAAAHACWREVRQSLFRDHASSPVPADRRSEFRAIHFPYDAKLRFELPLLPDDEPQTTAGESGVGGLTLPISSGRPLGFDRIGWLDVPFASGSRRLALFWLPEYAGGLFLPFRDATNGRETYGGGRYLLDTAKGADLGGDVGPDPSGVWGGAASPATVVADFNFAFQPSCAFDPRWSCPLSPLENRLDLEIRAGERIA